MQRNGAWERFAKLDSKAELSRSPEIAVSSCGGRKGRRMFEEVGVRAFRHS